MIEDPYLLLYLSTFLTVRDFIHLSQTSRLFTDDILFNDEIKKRIHSQTSVEFISNTNESVSSNTFKIYEFQEKIYLVFSLSSIPIEFIHNVPSERITFNIQTPNWKFRWSGVLFENDIIQLNNTSFIIYIAKTQYASIQLVAHRCDDNITITEIRFRFIRNISHKLLQEKRKRFVMTLCLILYTLYIVFGSNDFIIRIELFIYALAIACYITSDIPDVGNLFPIPAK